MKWPSFLNKDYPQGSVCNFGCMHPIACFLHGEEYDPY